MSKRRVLTRRSVVPNRVLVPQTPSREEEEPTVYSYVRVQDLLVQSLGCSVALGLSEYFFFEPGINWSKVVIPLFFALALVLLGPIGESKSILPEEV